MQFLIQLLQQTVHHTNDKKIPTNGEDSVVHPFRCVVNIVKNTSELIVKLRLDPLVMYLIVFTILSNSIYYSIMNKNSNILHWFFYYSMDVFYVILHGRVSNIIVCNLRLFIIPIWTMPWNKSWSHFFIFLQVYCSNQLGILLFPILCRLM